MLRRPHVHVLLQILMYWIMCLCSTIICQQQLQMPRYSQSYSRNYSSACGMIPDMPKERNHMPHGRICPCSVIYDHAHTSLPMPRLICYVLPLNVSDGWIRSCHMFCVLIYYHHGQDFILCLTYLFAEPYTQKYAYAHTEHRQDVRHMTRQPHLHTHTWWDIWSGRHIYNTH